MYLVIKMGLVDLIREKSAKFFWKISVGKKSLCGKRLVVIETKCVLTFYIYIRLPL